MTRQDPLYQYIKLELASTRRSVAPRHVPFDYPRDPLNRHYLEQRTWLPMENNPVVWPFLRRKLGAMFVRLGARLQGGQPIGEPAAGG